MRTRLVVAAVLVGITAAAVPAYGQGTGKRQHGGEQRTTQKPSKVNEGGYNAALKGIPNQKPPDPWKNVR